MPKIFELFGYRVDDKSSEAEKIRRAAFCPFMDANCDGGGNRYLSSVNLSSNKILQDYFKGHTTVPSGVCSLQLRSDDRPWIVCPRRLFAIAKSKSGQSQHQNYIQKMILQYVDVPSGTELGIWPEVKFKYVETGKYGEKSFDYTFDYILMPVKRVDQNEIEAITEKKWSFLQPILELACYPLAKRKGVYYVEDFPCGKPIVIEIMTSSTSGGNKTKRTTISMAFQDAILGKPHNAPGINYRQVWARMVSQFIVKSEVALGWGGHTIWLLQDALVDYISSSTALNMHQFLSEQISEVNVLSLSYGEKFKKKTNGVIELEQSKFYSGPIRPPSKGELSKSFQDIISAPSTPPISRLINLLAKRRSSTKLTVP